MKLLHEYNYNELSEVLYDFYYDIEKLKILIGYLEHHSCSDGVISTFHEIQNCFIDHEHDFNSVFSRINESAVPPEGYEEIPELVYPNRDCKVG